MSIRSIIIDDEPLARKGLKEYIDDVDFLELAGEFDSALKATDAIASGNIQLLFLDIEMPRITGLDFFKSLRQPPPVIFTTAYPQFALEGFEVNALDYLVKPFTFERFLKAALKAREYYEVRESNQSSRDQSDYFFIKADNRLVKIFFEEVLYVEALQNYVTIHTASRKYMTYLTFKAVEDYLPAEQFLKVHKSYIVAASKIDSIEGNDIRIGQQHIPISRNQKDEVMEKLLKNRFLKR
jgi:DNA-binding LytR/AlgR family response regulator